MNPLVTIPGWAPIETAPKDGTWVLAIARGAPAHFAVVVSYRTYHPNAKGKEEWRDAAGSKCPRVTHWMPLPEVPV